MPERASSSIVIDAPPEAVMAVIADFEAYPQWTSLMKDVQILERDGEGRGLEVAFTLDAGIVKDEYTLVYDWSRPDAVSWTLVRGQVQKSQVGTYELAATEAGTEVRYDLTLDLVMPMIGLFKRKAEKQIIDTALKGLKSRVEQG